MGAGSIGTPGYGVTPLFTVPDRRIVWCTTMMQLPQHYQRGWHAAVTRPRERLALHEAAARFGVSVQVLRNSIRAGKLPALRTGHVLWVRAADITALGLTDLGSVLSQRTLSA